MFIVAGGKDDDGNFKNGLTSGLSKKQRKARTAFTDHQLQTLEKSFERQKYLSVQDRMELANKLGLSDTQVKTWYQNRRYANVEIYGRNFICVACRVEKFDKS